MRVFNRLYHWTLDKAKHRHAPAYLGALSFAESSFFPIPPDTLLLPMTLAKPDKAWYFALITSLASVLGGVFGYLLGHFFWEVLEPVLLSYGYEEQILRVSSLFQDYGLWIVLLAGFTPLPYKLFTLVSGMMGLHFLTFVVASLLGRTPRFFLVAAAGKLLGIKASDWLDRYVERIGYCTLLLVIVFAVWSIQR